MRKISIASLAIGLALAFCAPADAAATRCHSMACSDRHSCHVLVNAKGLKGAAKQAEYDKCQADPTNYK
jgi:hypothetical protein